MLQDVFAPPNPTKPGPTDETRLHHPTSIRVERQRTEGSARGGLVGRQGSATRGAGAGGAGGDRGDRGLGWEMMGGASFWFRGAGLPRARWNPLRTWSMFAVQIEIPSQKVHGPWHLLYINPSPITLSKGRQIPEVYHLRSPRNFVPSSLGTRYGCVPHRRRP